MPVNIRQYEKEIIKLREQWFSGRQIQEKLGLTKKQYENFINRYNKKQSKILKCMPLKPKGRHTKVMLKQDEITKLKTKIKSLEMENELMRNFIFLVERK